MKPSLFLILVLLALPAPVSAQTPVGDPIQVASAFTGRPNGPHLLGPSVAMNSRGDFVVGWSRLKSPGGSPLSVFARLYAADGSPRTPEILIHGNPVHVADTLYAVRLAMREDGSFIAVYPAPEARLLAQRFTADGKPAGPGRVVAIGFMTSFEVGIREDGGFVVAWEDLSPNVYVRVFGADGRPVGPAFDAVTAMVGPPRLAVAPDGSFLVVWGETEIPSLNRLDSLLKGRLFHADGTPQGPVFLISGRLSETVLAGYDTAFGEAGNFLVTWLQARFPLPRPDLSAFVRSYSPDGSPLESPKPLGSRPAGQEIAADPGGGFLSIWKGGSHEPREIVVRRFSATGGTLGPLVRLGASLPPIYSAGPVLADNGTGSFVAAWLDRAPGGKGSVLLVQRLRTE
ncbi:MAG TPA: hypothetical protein VHC97_22795 [Thermoanaerobaculia bacterium]|jgi:hypothetical protein|nr:hypothetical protein [Thermoanaerobaculia bacterium]